MTVLAVTLAVVFAAWMAWRGCRHGATGTVLGWLPFLAAGVVLVVGLWLAWLAITCFVLLATVALVAAVATLVLCFWVTRSARRAAPPHRDERHESGRFRSSLRALDRFGGALLGLVAASVLCLAAATIGSAVPLAYSLGTAQPCDSDRSAALPAWVEGLSRACCAVADVATVGVLDHIPRLGAYAREVRALVVILNAPAHKLKLLAEKRGLTTLTDLPEVQAALADDAYLDLMVRVGSGDLSALRPLAEHPTTRGLLRCPEVRQFTSTLTPSVLARDLAGDSAAPPSPAPQAEVARPAPATRGDAS
ncbi:MAG TPA: hypothetical protein VNE39_06025 [Planctomycetota bacterium]|nr:hypothetical protein [Planctomycetota bacterium]